MACSTKNDLEDRELSVNQYVNIPEGYVTVENYNIVNNDIGMMDVKVHLDRLPSDVEYTEISIIDPFGDTVRTMKTNSIFVNRKPSGPSIYLLGLHNSNKPKKSSTHFIYTFTP